MDLCRILGLHIPTSIPGADMYKSHFFKVCFPLSVLGLGALTGVQLLVPEVSFPGRRRKVPRCIVRWQTCNELSWLCLVFGFGDPGKKNNNICKVPVASPEEKDAKRHIFFCLDLMV